MDHIEALGKRTDRHVAFSEELLADVDDAELTEIVEAAAADLGAPVALITLVLDRIQLFKAHYGLPIDLAVSRATERDISFCQFVVRDGETFEVVNAAEDRRVPQALVERYGIAAYLGIPLRVQDVVVGSLCVLDTKARRFTPDEHGQLTTLATRVQRRFELLGDRRRDPAMLLAQRSSGAGFAELRESLAYIRGSAAAAHIASATLRAGLRLASHVSTGGSAPPGALEGALAQSLLALEDLSESVHEVELSASDVEDCASALESVVLPAGRVNLSAALAAAQDLSRRSCRAVGGTTLPSFSVDPTLAAPRSLAVGVLSSVLSALATRMSEAGVPSGLAIDVSDTGAGASFIVSMSAPGLPEDAYEELCTELGPQVDDEPTVRLVARADAVCVSLAVAVPASS